MNRKMLVISLIVLLALSVGFVGGRGDLTAVPAVPNEAQLAALTTSSDAQVTAQSQNDSENSHITVSSDSPLAPVGTGFTYQGRLSQASSPSTGQFDFVFTLYDALAGGNAVGSPAVITLTNQTVSGGLFTVQLDFGPSAFVGDARWLELAVRQTGGGAYSTLSPRQPLTPAPYAQSATWQGTSGKPIPYNPLRSANASATLDSANFVGLYTSITIGADGLGLISYSDSANDNLKVAHCSNPACTSATSTAIDVTGNVGLHSSITIGTDGLGLISYYDSTNDDLKVAHCSNTACTSATSTTIDSTGDVGQYTSITIGVDGLGLISYYDVTNADLKAAHCNNTSCTSATVNTLESAGSVGQYTSITIGVDGLGLISYYDSTNADAKVAHCFEIACINAIRAELDITGSVGQYTSITIGADGLGLISYYDSSNDALKVAHCTSIPCVAGASSTTLASVGSIGANTSIAVGADGLAVISYYDSVNDDLKATHCLNADCTRFNTATLDSAGDIGQYSSLTIGADGLALVSYYDFINMELKAAKCSSVFCVSNFHRR